MQTIRGGAGSAKGNLSSKDTEPAEGVENAKSFPFFICRGSPDACRDVDVTLAICFCVLSALIVAFMDL